VIITPGGIATALAHLGIPAMNRAVKDGWQVEFATPPVRVNRRGYQTTFSLPMGVTPAMIADKRDVLARNLHRAPLEVWPTAAEQAGYVELWVADRGLTEKPAPPYPLLHEGTADVFTGVPFGVAQRGDVIAPALPGANVAFGGVMGQGKSNAARVMMAGVALDPLAELWVFVFANNGDFDAYQPRLARYHRGVDDTTLTTAVESLRDLYEEVGRREARLAAVGAKKVTRPLAEKYPDLRPLVALFSECHELFGHPGSGKEAADLAVQTMRRARKTAITLAFDTQSSRKDAIPPKIVELVKLNACFAVKSWRSNDGFLGDGSFQAGIRATELRMGKDIGTSILTGATPERFEIVKWFYIEADDDTGYDAATDIITRALTDLHPAVATTNNDKSDPGDHNAPRDLLVDLDQVLGYERVSVAEVPPLLRRHAPNWAPYQKLNGTRLREILAHEHGIKVPSTGNRFPLDPGTIRAQLAHRAAAQQADEVSG
jgi:S-DNA-T family DNA segregation ATPase FtsK/SpoIIIE